MTKEIIIDGVDVSGCCYVYDNEDLDYMCQDGMGTCICQENKSCYYKQLQKLKEENERLKNERTADLVKQLKDLRSENEALIKENEDMKKSFVSHSEFMDILENNPNINWEETAKENIYLINKYCKALEEIREKLCFGRTFYDGYFDKPKLSRQDEVIKLINEVLNG